jgi:hypothetical protein
MDAVNHPLDWWAYGGYPLVMRELRCTKSAARHRVRREIAAYFRWTGDPLWRPCGSRGYRELRRAIMENRALPDDLF